MTDLVVHIGLPKAGSTTLQDKIFMPFPGYLGIRNNKKKKEDLGKQFLDLVPSESNFLINNEEINRWVSCVFEHKELHCSSTDRLFISNEDLSNRSIAPFLSHFSKTNWKAGKVKALMIVRNQSEWLCSNYSQLSNRILPASQKHFEEQIQNLIDIGYIDHHFERTEYDNLFRTQILGFDSYYLDWSRRVEELYKALSSKNVCILLLEEMGTEQFRNKLFDFLQIENLNPELLSNRESAKNVRRYKDNIWKIRPWNASGTNEWVKSFWPPKRFPTSRPLALRILRKSSWIMNFNRETEFQLNESVRKQIREFCRPFNDRLSKQLGKDLEGLGY